MTLNEYQQHALETAIYPDDRRIIYPTLGLTGEAGEVADKVKKVIRDAHEEFTDEKRLEIVKEIGDVLWYCASGVCRRSSAPRRPVRTPGRGRASRSTTIRRRSP